MELKSKVSLDILLHNRGKTSALFLFLLNYENSSRSLFDCHFIEIV